VFLPETGPVTNEKRNFSKKCLALTAKITYNKTKGSYPMSDQIGLFLKILREEIEESLDNIQYLAGSYERKFKNGEITNYVYSENESFLAQEIAGLRRFLAFIASISPDVKTPEDIAILIGDVIKKKMKDYEDPEAVYRIINKKLEKSLRYLKLRQDP
jgi:hypothetical protein